MYSDAAFRSQDFVLRPYKKHRATQLTPTQKELNQWLSTKRIIVEHGFGVVKINFKLLSLRTSLLTRLSLIGLYMLVLAFIYNYRTCMRGGNQISTMFNLSPLSVEEYISGRFVED